MWLLFGMTLGRLRSALARSGIESLKTPPLDLEADAVSGALSEFWNLDVVALTYAPLGYGSHHWIAETAAGETWFVTVDDLRSPYLGDNEASAFAGLDRAFQVAAALRDAANLPFVNAPIANSSGSVLHRLTGRYSIAVFPFVDVAPTEFDRFPLVADKADAIRLVGQIHGATSHIPVGSLRAESFLIPNRAEFLQNLSDLDGALERRSVFGTRPAPAS